MSSEDERRDRPARRLQVDQQEPASGFVASARRLLLGFHLLSICPPGMALVGSEVRQFYHDLLIGLKQCDVPAWLSKIYLEATQATALEMRLSTDSSFEQTELTWSK